MYLLVSSTAATFLSTTLKNLINYINNYREVMRLIVLIE